MGLPEDKSVGFEVARDVFFGGRHDRTVEARGHFGADLGHGSERFKGLRRVALLRRRRLRVGRCCRCGRCGRGGWFSPRRRRIIGFRLFTFAIEEKRALGVGPDVFGPPALVSWHVIAAAKRGVCAQGCCRKRIFFCGFCRCRMEGCGEKKHAQCGGGQGAAEFERMHHRASPEPVGSTRPFERAGLA